MPGCSIKIGDSSITRWLQFSGFTVLLLVASLVEIIQVQAQTNQKIDATVQVSVCGNGIAEGGEQCDNADLTGKSCGSLQYESGTLACTKSCDFDLSKCVPFVNFAGEVLLPVIARQPTPTPKPISQIPFPETADSPDPTQLIEAINELPESTISAQISPLPTDSNLESDEHDAQPILLPEPIELRLQSIFELLEVEAVTESNQIDQAYLPALVHNWSQSWRKTTTLARFTTPTEVEQQVTRCDVNGDGVCTVEDLSILLYYVSTEPTEQQQ